MKRVLDVLGCLAAGARLTCRHVLLDALVAPERSRRYYYNHVAAPVGEMLLRKQAEDGKLAVLEADGDDVVRQDTMPVTLFGYDRARFTVTPSELLFLCSAVRRFRPRRILEIGTYLGNTTLHLAANAPEGARVYTVDLPPDGGPATTDLSTHDRIVASETATALGSRFRDTPYAAKITQILANSATYDFKRHEDSFDFIFIDASHSYEYVKKDSESALNLLAPGGLVFWHDYVSPIELTDVFRYLNELGRAVPLRHIRGTRLVYFRDPRPSRVERDAANGIEQLNKLETGRRG
ncbi:MAG: O-methyltransferase [Thermoanaerobaculia bacterium]